MRELILFIHYHFYGYNNKHYYTRNTFVRLICNVISRMCDYGLNLYLQLYCLFRKYPSPLNENNNIIVSLTSFPQRIDKVWMVIDSIFHQKMKPSKICLYLSVEEFPKGKKSLPKRLLMYEKLGLEICFRNENLKPHNKYYYALQEYSQYNVITIDDDMYYHHNLISNLWKLHTIYPTCICANTINIIQFDDEGNFTSYDKWVRPITKQNPSMYNLALGYNGVLYPHNIYTSQDVFDTTRIKELSLKADDLWLKIHQIKENVRVVCGDFFCTGISILGSQAISLMSTNCGNNENNIQWKNLCTYYKITKESFSE